MKKMDEMDRNIELRSTELGFKAGLLLLAVWTLYELWGKVTDGGVYNVLPCLILIAVLCVQRFSEMALKRKMIAGDEEYKEPNKLLRMVVLAVAAVAIILSAGIYLASIMG